MSTLPQSLESLEQAYEDRRRRGEDLAHLHAEAVQFLVRLGIEAQQKRSAKDLDAALRGFLTWRDRARRDKKAKAFKEAVRQVGAEQAAAGARDLFDEFLVGVRLMAIEDPFEAWKELGREISKHWPKGLSAVDAIREQRDKWPS